MSRMHAVRAGVFALLLGMAVAAPVSAQESRGTILGRVSDAQGALTPGASVAVTNRDTNATSRLVTNETGYYEAPFLVPGSYVVTVELTGFKKIVRGPVELNVGSRLEIDIALELGQISESVTVTTEVPILETTTASAGRVIQSEQLLDLPFSSMNPFLLAGLAPGMQWTGAPQYNRPFDNGGTSDYNTAGGVGQNEYSIDGASANGTERRVGYVPNSDAIAEFKIETSNFDAAYGNTTGATVNVMTKSGTNRFHGSLFDQHWQQRWNATPHFTRLAWEEAVRKGALSKDDPKQQSGRSNQFGGTLGGPVVIPRIVNGRNKLFFFVSYSGIYQRQAEAQSKAYRAVPKMAWRQGDFSDMLAIDAARYQIYDPRSATLQNGKISRMPFPGNMGIPVLNPMYKFYEKIYPAPNDVAGVVDAEGRNNYFAVRMPKNDNFNNVLNRFDYNINDRHKVFARWYWNHRLANESDWTYETMPGLQANGLTRINKGAGGDYVWTVSGRTVANVTVAFQRFSDGSDSPVRTKFKPSDVGLPAYMDQQAGEFHQLPRLDFDSIEDVGGSYPWISTRGSVGEGKANITHIAGSHTLRAGWEERRYWKTEGSPGTTSGTFRFRRDFVRKDDSDSKAQHRALEWASFMMGLPNGMSGVNNNDSAFWSTPRRSFYLQDDWRIFSRLRLSLGLRFEWEQGTTERFNRAIGGGFDPGVRMPYSDAVEAAYARNPLPELAASQFKVQGAGFYLGQNGPRTMTDGSRNWLPRLGVVYQFTPRTVLRAGYGLYADTFNVNNNEDTSQYGYSKDTSTTLTTDRGLTFCCSAGGTFPASQLGAKLPVNDPFPVRSDGTRFDKAYGNSLGAVAFAGRDMDPFFARDYIPARQQRWRIGVQRELRKDVVLELSYNGAYSRVPVDQAVNYLPASYYSPAPVRNQAMEDEMNRQLPNPFYFGNFTSLQNSNPVLFNYLTTQGRFNNTTISKGTLLRPYPNLGGSVNGLRPGLKFKDTMGKVRYHDMQVQLEKRFSQGLATSVMYTYGDSDSKTWYRNSWDPEPSWTINNDTRPHRFIWTGTYDLPLGRNRRFMTRHPLQHVVGGWQVGWIYTRQSGSAFGFGNRFFYGDLNDLAKIARHDEVHGNDIHSWFDSSMAYTAKTSGPIPAGFVGFEGRGTFQPTYNVRTLPNNFGDMRNDGIINWDVNVKRDFRVTESFKVRFGMDLLNATNHTNFDSPVTDPTSSAFGTVNKQRGLSRMIQFNLRLQF